MTSQLNPGSNKKNAKFKPLEGNSLQALAALKEPNIVNLEEYKEAKDKE